MDFCKINSFFLFLKKMDMDDMDVWCEFGAPDSMLEDCIQDFSGFEADLEMLEVNVLDKNYSEGDTTARQFILGQPVYDEISPKLYENNIARIEDFPSPDQSEEIVCGVHTSPSNVDLNGFNDEDVLDLGNEFVAFLDEYGEGRVHTDYQCCPPVNSESNHDREDNALSKEKA